MRGWTRLKHICKFIKILLWFFFGRQWDYLWVWVFCRWCSIFIHTHRACVCLKWWLLILFCTLSFLPVIVASLKPGLARIRCLPNSRKHNMVCQACRKCQSLTRNDPSWANVSVHVTARTLLHITSPRSDAVNVKVTFDSALPSCGYTRQCGLFCADFEGITRLNCLLADLPRQ